MQQSTVSLCLSWRRGCLSLQRQGVHSSITGRTTTGKMKFKEVQRWLKSCWGHRDCGKEAGAGKTSSRNFCSGIQDTGQGVILEASKLWDLASLFRLLPGLVCSYWQKHILLCSGESQWLYAWAHYLLNSIRPLVIPPSAGKLSSPTCLFASQPRCESRRIHRSEFLHLHVLVLLERRGGYACFFICRHNPDL